VYHRVAIRAYRNEISLRVDDVLFPYRRKWNDMMHIDESLSD
jgi:hypothetical protein